MTHWNHKTIDGPDDTGVMTGCAHDAHADRRPPPPHVHAQALLTACRAQGWPDGPTIGWIADLAASGTLSPQ